VIAAPLLGPNNILFLVNVNILCLVTVYMGIFDVSIAEFTIVIFAIYLCNCISIPRIAILGITISNI
jgi:hypothetical protein